MSNNEEFKKFQELMENFNDKFEKVVLDLISKFNEIKVSHSKVQESMDFLEDIKTQNDENNKLLSTLSTQIQELEQTLQTVSLTNHAVVDKEVVKSKQELDDVLKALDKMMIEDTPATSTEELKEFEVVNKMPKVEEILKKQKEEIETIKSELTPTLEPTLELKQTPTIEQETEIKLTPVPKLASEKEKYLNLEEGLTPVPKLVKEKEEILVSEEGLTPVPKLEALKKKIPDSEVNLTSPKIEIKSVESLEKSSQKIKNLEKPEDVFHNLMIDIDSAEDFEQLGLTIKKASDSLKQFVKFHKVLFDMLKVASTINKEKGDFNQNFKEDLKKKVEKWRKAFFNV